MTIKDDEEQIVRYWHPEKIKIDYSITEEEADKKLKKLFSKAVEKHLSNIKETGFEVSGGLDSSSVVSLLSQNTIPSDFDKKLVEFALSLPPEMKYKQRTIKWILRKAMDGVLPNKIRDRKDKAEFFELITQQIDAIDLGELLDDPYIVKLGLIEHSLVDKYRKAYEDKTIKYIVILWTIINMEYCYRHNFEKDSLKSFHSNHESEDHPYQ